MENVWIFVIFASLEPNWIASVSANYHFVHEHRNFKNTPAIFKRKRRCWLERWKKNVFCLISFRLDDDICQNIFRWILLIQANKLYPFWLYVHKCNKLSMIQSRRNFVHRISDRIELRLVATGYLVRLHQSTHSRQINAHSTIFMIIKIDNIKYAILKFILWQTCSFLFE